MKTPSENQERPPLSAAGWIALAVLLGLLLVSLWYAAKAWTAMAAVPMSGWGWLFLGLGIVVTIGLGVGLMGLVFYSSRNNLDQ